MALLDSVPLNRMTMLPERSPMFETDAVSAEWHQVFARIRTQDEINDQQDLLRASAVLAMREATDALKQYHAHQREHGQTAVIPVAAVDDLLFWAGVIISYPE